MPTAERLAAFDVVIKSPGISPYRAEVVAAQAQRHALHRRHRSCGFPSAPMRARCASPAPRARARRPRCSRTCCAPAAIAPRWPATSACRCWNCWMPMPSYWAIELSSYQTGDVADSGVRPEVAVALNVFPEHLDWHGSQARYVADKLRLLTDAHAADRRAQCGRSDARRAGIAATARCAGSVASDGWHLRGDVLYRGDARVMETSSLPLPGRHNRGNLCAVLTAIEAIGLDAAALAPHAATLPAAAASAAVPRHARRHRLRQRFDQHHAACEPRGARPVRRPSRRDPRRRPRSRRRLGWLCRCHAQAAAACRDHDGRQRPPRSSNCSRRSQRAAFALDAAGDLADAMHKARVAARRPTASCCCRPARRVSARTATTPNAAGISRAGGFDPDAIASIAGLGIA